MFLVDRNVGQTVIITCDGQEIRVTVTKRNGGRAGLRLGIEAPPSCVIERAELRNRELNP